MLTMTSRQRQHCSEKCLKLYAPEESTMHIATEDTAAEKRFLNKCALERVHLQ